MDRAAYIAPHATKSVVNAPKPISSPAAPAKPMTSFRGTKSSQGAGCSLRCWHSSVLSNQAHHRESDVLTDPFRSRRSIMIIMCLKLLTLIVSAEEDVSRKIK